MPNNIGTAEVGGGGLLVDVFETPPHPGAGSAPSVTPGAEENVKKLVLSRTALQYSYIK